MRPLQVDPDGLHRLAARCRVWSTELSGTCASIPEESTWATVCAAGALDDAVAATADDLAGRMREIADLLDTAASAHRTADETSAAVLGDCTARPS